MDRKLLIPSSILLKGEYGISDSCTGVPVILGKNGVEEVIKLELNEDEIEVMKMAAEDVISLVS
jgi:malate dehydrogenase